MRVSQALDRVRQVARLRKKERFTALLHHVGIDLLRMAFYALQRDAAAGVDGLSWRDYEADLEPRLKDLHARVQRGAYRALPSRRRYILKPDGRQRPLAVAALEDKIVQRATAVVLNAIYEEDFLGFSYGFRPGCNQHDALDALIVGISGTKVNWILDADIRSFFDAVSQSWLVRLDLQHKGPQSGGNPRHGTKPRGSAARSVLLPGWQARPLLSPATGWGRARARPSRRARPAGALQRLAGSVPGLRRGDGTS